MFEPLFSRLSDSYHRSRLTIRVSGTATAGIQKHSPTRSITMRDHESIHGGAGLSHYTLYMQDYGGPVGFRMALVHPERIEALMVQGCGSAQRRLGSKLKTRRAFWADRIGQRRRAADKSLILAPRARAHRKRSECWSAMTPICGPMNSTFRNQPGQAEIQSDLFYDYRTNVDSYQGGKHG